MMFGRKTVGAALLALGLLGGAGLRGQAPARGGAEKAPAADADFVAWVDRLVTERRPGPGERRFDEIGWAADLRTAERLAKEHNRPVFLFTHDGRMNVGRC
jgi:hypothetical protein